MILKFKVGDEAFCCQGKDILDVGIVVDIKDPKPEPRLPSLGPPRKIYVRWQSLGKIKSHREDHIKSREEIDNERA